VNNYFSNPQVVQFRPIHSGQRWTDTGSIRTPTSFTSDLSIAKQFLLSNVHEGVRLELRLEAQNALNHPSSVRPTPTPATQFGVTNYLAVNPRQCQWYQIVF